ncbi:immunity 26/phosphotriesterase HocA family protein [Lacrimispora sp.]|uniref:immunity 26/phosphotriesterase HocA family protein n=1 Tax=Lacrimispora sp. TaxID=2719234 RepID=UPI003995B509
MKGLAVKNLHEKIWGWEKKKRTMLRYIKPGDIFCFSFDEESYCFGRIVAKITFGHVAEIFNHMSSEPIIDEEEIVESSRLIEPVILDSYSLFDRKAEGDWRIIGHQEEYVPEKFENVYFAYGLGHSCKITDIWGNEKPISEEEKNNYHLLSPKGDFKVKELIKAKRG